MKTLFGLLGKTTVTMMKITVQDFIAQYCHRSIIFSEIILITFSIIENPMFLDQIEKDGLNKIHKVFRVVYIESW